MSRAASLALAAALALTLAACGRKAPPHPAENAFYPQHYPPVLVPSGTGGPSEGVGESEYQQLQQRQQRENAGQPGVLLPLPPAQPAPQPGYDDLRHPSADTDSESAKP